MNINMEFNTKFDNSDYLITIQSNWTEKLIITIEEESTNAYWKKELDSKTIGEITTQMGSYKSLEVFTKMLLCALRNENENITLNFCSLNEIHMLSESKKSGQDLNVSSNKEDNIKKYLMLVYTQFEKVVYPIQLEYLGNTPSDPSLLLKTISRLKEKIKNLNESQANNSALNINDLGRTVNYNDYEKLKKENANLINKIKILESYRPMGAVDNDDIYKNYAALNDEYEQYKIKNENKIKMLLKSLDELKENQSKENKNIVSTNDKNKSKIKELEDKLDAATDMLNNERRQAQLFIEEKNKEIEVLRREIKIMKENEKAQKAKISRLEKDLDRSQQASAYYRYGTPKSSRSFKSSSNNSYTNSYSSGFSSSKRSNVSYIKKNLIPSIGSKNTYNKYKPSYKTNYTSNYLKKTSSNKSSKSNSVKSRSKSKGPSSIKSGSSTGSKGKSKYTTNSKYSFKPTTYHPYIPKSNKVFSKPKVNKGSIGKTKNVNIKSNKYTPATNNKISPSINNNITCNNVVNNANTLNNNTIKKNESINVAERLGRLQDLINQANKQ